MAETDTAEPTASAALRADRPRRSPGRDASPSSARSPASGSWSWTARWARWSRATACPRPTSAGRASATTARDLRGDNDLLCADPARHRPGDPRRLPRGRRRHHRDEHVHRDVDRPGRLWPRGRRPRDERGRGPDRARGRGRVRGARARPSALRLWGDRPDQPVRLDLARREPIPVPGTSASTISSSPTARRPTASSRAGPTSSSSRRSSTRSTPRRRSSPSTSCSSGSASACR